MKNMMDLSTSSIDSGTSRSSDTTHNTTPNFMSAVDLYKELELNEYRGDEGNCQSPATAADGCGTCDGTSFHSNLIRFSKSDVFKKYELIEQIGTGSMGTVSTVRIRPEKFGGSAYECRSRYDLFGIPILRGKKKIMVPLNDRPNFQSHDGPNLQRRNSDGPNLQRRNSDGPNLQRRNSSLSQSSGGSDESVGGEDPHQLQSTELSSTSQQMHQTQQLHHEHLYALKTIHLDRALSSTYVNELQNEIDILRSLDHPNIVKMLEVYHDKRQKHIYVILELCGNGSDLFTKSPYTFKQSQKIMSECCSAIHYMHQQNVVHRDIKYENILFSYEGPINNKPTSTGTTAGVEDEEVLPPIKIIDFGLSKKFARGTKPELMTDRVGTIYTMSPQVLEGEYSSQADMWSLGVISYMLLSASKPFYHKKRSLMIDSIMRGKPKYDTPLWESVDESAKDFIQNLIVVDPEQRMDSTTALKHPWITNRTVLPIEKPSDDLLHKVDSSLLNYKYTSQLKKIALNVIALRSTATEIVELIKVFEALDIEKNGIITISEFKQGLEMLDHSNDLMQDLFASIDIQNSGHIMYTEFLAATLEAQGQIEEDRIAEAFDRIDSDGTGYITKRNLIETLGADCSKKYINDIIKAADYDHDGKVSYKEFLRAFRETRGARYQKASWMSQVDNDANTPPEGPLPRIGEEGDQSVTSCGMSQVDNDTNAPPEGPIPRIGEEGDQSVTSSTSKSELLGSSPNIPVGRFETDMRFLSIF